MLSENDLAIRLEFALESVWQAGKITLAHFQTGVTVEHKADRSPVTLADRLAEQYLRQRIARYWPADGIVGEEFGSDGATNGLSWLVDPIDGTNSFIRGVPLYANLIALADEAKSLLGVVNFPALGEVLHASRDKGCHWNGRRAHVSKVDCLQDATLVGTEVHMRDDAASQSAWSRLVTQTGFQRTWGEAYGFALVATGRADVMIDSMMKVWDCGPHQVILEEAGGTFTDWSGTPTIFEHNAVATNGILLESVLTQIREP